MSHRQTKRQILNDIQAGTSFLILYCSLLLEMSDRDAVLDADG